MDVSDLREMGLDWAVATVDPTVEIYQVWEDQINVIDPNDPRHFIEFSPTTNREQGYAIIEREGITTGPHTTSPYVAHYGPSVSPGSIKYIGATPLEAGLRCYVAKMVGKEISLHVALLPSVMYNDCTDNN